MIYLAEVQRDKTGFRGIAKSELKLLALQRSAKSWITVQGEEAISLEQSHNFNLGVLVIVQLNTHRQIQDIQVATQQLPHILQKLSQQLETFQNQEEEIKLWRESLHYQSEEMNCFKMETEAQLQEIEVLREQTEQLRQEMQSGREQLELAQENLRQEQQALAEEKQRSQSLETQRQELEQQQQKFGDQQQQIAKAWEDLRYEKLCMEELQQEIHYEQERLATTINNVNK